MSALSTVIDRARPYYGWYLTLTLALTETISWGILYYAFTVFLTPMERDLGWTRTELTGGFSLMMLVAGGMALPVGIWIGRFGARLLMTVGAAGASLLVIAWSMVGTLPGFYLVFAGMGVCAACVLYEPAFAVIAGWFRARRGAALAIVTFAAGFASTLFLPLCDALLQAFGWRLAVLLLGVFLGCITLPLHALMLRRRPSDLGLLPDGEAISDTTLPPAAPAGMTVGAALRMRAFWMTALGFGLITLSASAIRVHFIPFLIGVGVDPSTAAFATGVIGAMQVAGRVVFAPLERRFSIWTIVVSVFALHAVAGALLLTGHTALAIGGFILLFGAAQGAFTLVRPALIAEVYGVAHYGRISSVLALLLTLAGTSAPLAAGLVYDRFGDYQWVLWGVVVLAIAATAVIREVRRSAPG